MALVLLQGKVLPELLAKFKEAQENSDAETFNAFFELLMEAYLNPKTKIETVPTPTDEQAEIVKNLKLEMQYQLNEIGRLKTDRDLNKQHIEAMGEETRLLTKQLQQAQSEGLKLSDGQEVITIPPVVSRFLDIEAETAAKKSGQTWTRTEVLLNTFWESVKNGAAHPFRVWSNSEISAIVKQINSETAE